MQLEDPSATGARHGRSRGALLVSALLALGACPGEMDPPTRYDGGADGAWLPTWESGGWPIIDQGLPGDAGPFDGEAGAASRPDLSTTVGGSCPCAVPLYCVANACRRTCTLQSCNGLGGCGTGEACVRTQPGIPVCVPAAAKGQSCSAGAPCAGGHLCLTSRTSSASGTCYATCGTSASCATKSTCYALTGGSCRFCYP